MPKKYIYDEIKNLKDSVKEHKVIDLISIAVSFGMEFMAHHYDNEWIQERE